MHEQSTIGAVWHKSTRSSSNGNCVEVADNLPGIIAVRDSKNPTGDILLFDPTEWKAFLHCIKNGEFDR